MNFSSADRPTKSTTKLCDKAKSGFQLVAQYDCRQGKGFSIVINSRLPKPEKHSVYGDRLEKIISEVHEFYQEVKGNQRLVKSIKLPLGDTQLLKDEKSLVTQIFPKMSELREMQSGPQVTSKQVSPKILLQVLWRGTTQPTTLKCSYVREYESQLYNTYNFVRKMFQDKWKAYIKRTGKGKKKPSQQKSRKRLLGDSSDFSFGEMSGRKMLKVPSQVVVDSSLQQSGLTEFGDGDYNGHDSTEDHDKDVQEEDEEKRPNNYSFLEENRVNYRQGNRNNNITTINQRHSFTKSISQKLVAKPPAMAIPMSFTSLPIKKHQTTTKPMQKNLQDTVVKTQQTQYIQARFIKPSNTKPSYFFGNISNSITKKSAPVFKGIEKSAWPEVIEIDDD